MKNLLKSIYVPLKEYAISFLKWLVLGVVVGIIGGVIGIAFAKTIGFVHPKTENYMEFDAPLPDYFVHLLNQFHLFVTM